MLRIPGIQSDNTSVTTSVNIGKFIKVRRNTKQGGLINNLKRMVMSSKEVMQTPRKFKSNLLGVVN